ncbi:hypothetical protein ROZALSC1DRAFT_29264 [Rozella allomycis CSF55]|uniref:Uncharacterized protein n=1 Tax=Rozella allomycis (strain CSF55) TaxID=988480 RepID=A0A075AQ89_ROZAC|nr:hypothetical protein O9G_002218 [Rozella allomycis CSF55]RKP19114.1 hypothetical protein ROZALSC1DRAFT_29264 [Rozella allomycis CSF55]|eukprot:EPZ32378.1 hypothetical protein O9G_002218 [Rozella allomycis CSF55]
MSKIFDSTKEPNIIGVTKVWIGIYFLTVAGYLGAKAYLSRERRNEAKLKFERNQERIRNKNFMYNEPMQKKKYEYY